MAHLVRMADDLMDILRHQCVHDVKEVLPIWHATNRQLRWKVHHERRVTLHLWPERLHRELIVKRHVDHLHVAEVHESLVVGEELLDEVLVHPGIDAGQHVEVLTCTRAGSTSGGPL